MMARLAGWDGSAGPGAAACDDGIDNDDDGLTDFPDDPGCRDRFWASENPECQDGISNDSDGLVDFPADPGCPNRWGVTESPQCDDGIDNDGDLLIDYPDDTNCWLASGSDEQWVFYPVCGLGVELTPVLMPLVWLARRRRGSGSKG
jgi:endoglucanase